jgi:hypothetical protein
MMRDENQVKKCEKYLILLNKLAGVVQWQNGSFLLFEGLFVPTRCTGAFGPRSKTDLVNPPFEQGHWKAFAVARRYRFLFVA